jgi:uncharacterized OsmC-like protein
MDYKVVARRVDAQGSRAWAKAAEVALGTDLAGREDAFNPVELLLAALAACMIKGVEVRLEAIRQDAPPKLVKITYEILVESGESEARLALLHRNVLKYGTISNTLSGALPLEGVLRRAG